MPSDIYRTIRDAIRRRKQIGFGYGGKQRVLVPTVLGYGSEDREALFAYQVDGETSPGNTLPAWRCFYLAAASDIVVLDEDIPAGFEGVSHKFPQSCVKSIDVDVNIPETLTSEIPLPPRSSRLRPPRGGH